jgi:hypothetical protein
MRTGRLARLGALGVFAGAAAALAGCSTPPPSPRAAARTDKRTLYGDAALVPTREGERARNELALAAQIVAALRVLPAIEEVAADVELWGEPSPRVVVVARTRGAHDPTRLQPEVDAIARAIVGPAEVHVQIAAPEPTPPLAPDRNPVLVLALLGLGVSLGVAIERVRHTTTRARRP